MNNVPSLKLCKKLKELWLKTPKWDLWYNVYREKKWFEWSWSIISRIESMKWDYDHIYYAPNVMNLIDMLPDHIKDKKWSNHYLVIIKNVWYIVKYWAIYDFGDFDYLPDVLAETIIRCIEEWHLDFKKHQWLTTKDTKQ